MFAEQNNMFGDGEQSLDETDLSSKRGQEEVLKPIYEMDLCHELTRLKIVRGLN